MLFGVAISVKRRCRGLAPGEVRPVTFEAGARRLVVRQPPFDRGIRHDIGTAWLSWFADGSPESRLALIFTHTDSMPNPHLHLQADRLYHFDARGIAKRFRHAAIFGALDALVPGDTMRFHNDHDPLPLLDQLRARYGDRVAISYVSRQPGEIVIDFAVTEGSR